MKIKDTELKCIKLSDGDQIPFVNRTKEYGLAAFRVCPKFKYGKLVKLSIYPLQQKNIDYYYEWEGRGKYRLTIQSYQGLGDPNIWEHSYCKEHKCQSMYVSTPNGANYIWFNVFSDNIAIGFLKNKH